MLRNNVLGSTAVVLGLALNNYAFLHGLEWGPKGAVIVLDSTRYALAAAGVIAVSLGLLFLLRWARSVSGPRAGGPRTAV
jgi:hypothetical protein